MSRRDNYLDGLKPGDQFDPQDVTRRLRVYPVDVVDARPDIHDGPKRLYSKLFRIAAMADRRKHPWPGYVYASEDRLVGLLGKSTASIRRDSAALRSFGLVGVDRPNRRGNNHYSFLWQSEFDSADVSAQVLDDRSNLSGQRPLDSSNVSGRDSAHVSGRYKEELEVLTHTPRAQENGFRQIEKSTVANARAFEGKKAAANGAAASASTTSIRGNQTSPASEPPPRANWPMGGWESPEDFETWWAQVVRGHPNKNRNACAKTKALELTMAGELARPGFEAGYAALRERDGDRWTEERGRYAPNLWQLLDDRAWKYAPDTGPPKPPVPEYPAADDYTKRVQAEC